MQIKHCVVYVARLIEKVGEHFLWMGLGGGQANAAPICNECQLLGNHCIINQILCKKIMHDTVIICTTSLSKW